MGLQERKSPTINGVRGHYPARPQVDTTKAIIATAINESVTGCPAYRDKCPALCPASDGLGVLHALASAADAQPAQSSRQQRKAPSYRLRPALWTTNVTPCHGCHGVCHALNHTCHAAP